MGSTRRARILLKACLGQLLANAPVQAQGEAWLAMAKCDVAESSLGSLKRHDLNSGREGRDKVEGLTRGLLHLDRAITLLKRCHHFAGLRECLYLKVRRGAGQACCSWFWNGGRGGSPVVTSSLVVRPIDTDSLRFRLQGSLCG